MNRVLCVGAGALESARVIATQTKLLAVKNVKLHLRSRVSTATQLCVGPGSGVGCRSPCCGGILPIFLFLNG